MIIIITQSFLNLFLKDMVVIKNLTYLKMKSIVQLKNIKFFLQQNLIYWMKRLTGILNLMMKKIMNHYIGLFG